MHLVVVTWAFFFASSHQFAQWDLGEVCDLMSPIEWIQELKLDNVDFE